jgi:glycosyltransferase involved in cell wall biosynthesis
MQKKHKIIHIITRLDKGGSAENTFLTVLGIDKKKYEVLLVKGPTYESKMSKEEHVSVISGLKEAKSEEVKIVNNPFLLRRINPVYDLLALFSLCVFLIKEKPTIVHTHTSKAGLLGRLAAKLAGVPIIVHTPHGHIFFGYFGPLITKIFILLERLASRITEKTVALTNKERDDYVLFNIDKKDKFLVIFSGVELKKFKELSLEEKLKFKKELGLPDNSLVVGTAGRLVPVKGPEYLIKAAKYVISKHPDTFFIFTGDGPLRQDLEKEALSLGIKENIIFMGWRNDVVNIISIYDVFALPSLNEGMGRVLVEAMALGKELARYIQILIEEEEKREKMGLAGKMSAHNFSKEIMVERITNLYDELLQNY